MRGFIGIVCGLKSEARCLPHNHSDYEVAISGANADRAREAAENLVWKQASGLVSFGLSGALDAELKPGGLLVSSVVITAGGEAWNANMHWLGRAIGAARAADLDVTSAGILGSDELIASPDEKVTLGRRTATVAVDMESHAVAEVAAEHGIPFLAVRAIADPAHRTIPVAATSAVGEDGAARPGAVLAGLARRPQDLVSLIKLASDARKGHASLRGAARALLPALLD